MSFMTRVWYIGMVLVQYVGLHEYMETYKNKIKGGGFHEYQFLFYKISIIATSLTVLGVLLHFDLLTEWNSVTILLASFGGVKGLYNIVCEGEARYQNCVSQMVLLIDKLMYDESGTIGDIEQIDK